MEDIIINFYACIRCLQLDDICVLILLIILCSCCNILTGLWMRNSTHFEFLQLICMRKDLHASHNIMEDRYYNFMHA